LVGLQLNEDNIEYDWQMHNFREIVFVRDEYVRMKHTNMVRTSKKTSNNDSLNKVEIHKVYFHDNSLQKQLRKNRMSSVFGCLR